MTGFSGGGIVPPAGDIGGTLLLPRIRDIGAVPITLTGGAPGDVLTEQGDGSYKPAPGSGGGGGIVAMVDVLAGPELLTPDNGQWFPFSTLVNASSVGAIGTQVPLLNPSTDVPSGDDGIYRPSFGSSWYTILAAGQSANILPTFGTPHFSGGTGVLHFNFYYWAISSDFTEGSIRFVEMTVPTFTNQQMTPADVVSTIIAFGADLASPPTAGVGNSGNGLVSAGGGKPYIAGINGSIVIPPGTTFP